jgi:hypothetical protein
MRLKKKENKDKKYFYPLQGEGKKETAFCVFVCGDGGPGLETCQTSAPPLSYIRSPRFYFCD